MNGGVLHAVEVLQPTELDTAIAGYRRFGFSGAAAVLSLAKALSDSDKDAEEARLDRDYATAVPDDASLDAAMDRVDPLPKADPFPADGTADTIAAAIEEFIEQSKLAQQLSGMPGKSRQQHRAHDRYESAVRKLLGVWDAGGHEAFLALLDESDDVVRASAAAYLCESDPQKAIGVLEAIDNGPPSPAGTIAFGVLFALKRGQYRPLTRLREIGTN